MQDFIGATFHPFDSHLSVTGVKECEQFCTAIALILVRVVCRFAFCLPRRSGHWCSLKWASLILTPHVQAELLAQRILCSIKFFWVQYLGQ